MRRWTALLLAAGILLALAACGLRVAPQEQEKGREIYYLAPGESGRGGDMIRPSEEQLGLPEDAPLGEVATAVVERLMAGPSDGTLRSPIPRDVELLSLEVKNGVASVDLSEEFTRLSGVDLSLADYCLTISLTTLEGISAVSITARGRAIGQQPEQIFLERDVLLSTERDVLQTAEVTLYFQNSDGELVGEPRTLEIYEGQTLSESLVAAMQAGPEDRDLLPVLPENFVVSAARVDSGVCYLNLAASTLETLPEEEAAQRLILRSLVDSLYSVETIQELRLLADGKELIHFGAVLIEEVTQKSEYPLSNLRR